MLIKEAMLDFVKPEYKKLIRNKFNEAENFFKHADYDHEKSLDFNPKLSELLIIDALSHYYNLTGEDTPIFKIYRAWHIINNPSMFNFPEETRRMMGNFDAEHIKSLGKSSYFNLMLPTVMKFAGE